MWAQSLADRAVAAMEAQCDMSVMDWAAVRKLDQRLTGTQHISLCFHCRIERPLPEQPGLNGNCSSVDWKTLRIVSAAADWTLGLQQSIKSNK